MNKFFETGKNWPFGIILFFIVVAAVNISFLYLSLANRPPIVSDNPYEDSLKFQEILDARNQARPFFDHLAEGVCNADICTLTFELIPKKPIDLPGAITIKLQRIGTEDKKLQAETQLNDKGTYFLNSTELGKGLWLLEVNFLLKGKKALLRDKVLFR